MSLFVRIPVYRVIYEIRSVFHSNSREYSLLPELHNLTIDFRSRFASIRKFNKFAFCRLHFARRKTNSFVTDSQDQHLFPAFSDLLTLSFNRLSELSSVCRHRSGATSMGGQLFDIEERQSMRGKELFNNDKKKNMKNAHGKWCQTGSRASNVPDRETPS